MKLFQNGVKYVGVLKKKKKTGGGGGLVSKFYLTLCNPVDCSPPDSSVYGISQVRILEWVAVSFSSRSSPPRD